MSTVEDVCRAEWDATNYASKDNLLRVVREEAEAFFALAEEPENWKMRHDLRSLAGPRHRRPLIDTTEGYLERFETTRPARTAEAIAPLTEMAVDTPTSVALAFRDTCRRRKLMHAAPRCLRSRDEDVRRGGRERLGLPSWSRTAYMGPVPAFFYPIGQLMDYGVHGWDVREGLDMPHFLNADAADLLVPFMFVLWQATYRRLPARRRRPRRARYGCPGATAGRGGSGVNGEGMTYEPGDADDAPALIDFDPASLVLTAFGRARSGNAVRGPGGGASASPASSSASSLRGAFPSRCHHPCGAGATSWICRSSPHRSWAATRSRSG